ncbi:MAG: MBL fold metallo-hydrolase [Myxococcota bacterium]
MARVDEVADGVFRIHHVLDALPGGFSFNQYLVVDDEALLFHTGMAAMASDVLHAIRRVIPLHQLRYIGVGHVESDECGGLAAILAQAPNAQPLCSRIGAMTGLADFADGRTPHAAHDDATIAIGNRPLRWIDAPHVPHGWDNGVLFDERTQTLLCGDLFSQPGSGDAPHADGASTLEACEAFRREMDYFSHAPQTLAMLQRLAELAPRRLACMHGSTLEGDGGALLNELGSRLGAPGSETTPPRPPRP